MSDQEAAAATGSITTEQNAPAATATRSRIARLGRWLMIRWRWFVYGVVILCIAGFISASLGPPLQACMHEFKDGNPNDPHPEKPGLIRNFITCSWLVVGENDKPLMVFATMALFLVTAFLWIETKRLAKEAAETADAAAKDAERVRGIMEEQHTAMNASATAAKNLAAAAVDSERAFVFLDTTKTAADPHNAPSTAKPGRRFELYFINLGRTPAQVESMELAFGVWEKRDLEQLADHPNGKVHLLGFWLGQNVSSDPQRMSGTLSAEDAQRAHFGESVEAILGRVRFADVFGNRHETGFAIELSKGGAPPFTTIQNKNLNYTREQTE